MKKVSEITDQMALEYATKALDKSKNAPKLVFKSIKKGSQETYHLSYSAKSIYIEADSALAAAFAVGQLTTTVAGGHYAEFLGVSSPKYALRPLWIGGSALWSLTETLGIFLPEKLCIEPEHSIPMLAKRVIELGYNAIMFGLRESSSGMQSLQPSLTLNELIKCFRDYGLKVIIKPHFLDYHAVRQIGRSPYNPHFREFIGQAIEQFFGLVDDVDYIYWEGAFFYPDCVNHATAKNATQLDLATAEVKMLEDKIGERAQLIYCLPAIDLPSAKLQADWFPMFCDQTGQKTLLSFPVVSGEPCSDHLPSHPFWQALRKSPDCSSTKLLPLINLGAIKQGEGLWPSLSLDLIDQYISRCYRHEFAGVIGLINHLPVKGGLLDCNLWVASQALWRETRAELLAETWFEAHRPELDFPRHGEALKSVRSIAVKLSLMRSLINEKNRDSMSQDEGRALTESLAAQLKQLSFLFQNQHYLKNKIINFENYYKSFYKDAAHTILLFLQCFNIPMHATLNLEENCEGFWTQISKGLGQGMRSGAKVTFLDAPNASANELIFNSTFISL